MPKNGKIICILLAFRPKDKVIMKVYDSLLQLDLPSL